MAKFWNFVLFQAGWFACVIGASYERSFWPVLATLAYLGVYVWRSPNPSVELKLLIKAAILGVSADTLIVNLGYLSFNDSWLGSHIAPVWMWVLWALVASTINGSLSWLRGRMPLAAALGAITGPLSYEAGIRMGAGAWVPGHEITGFILVGVIWAASIPLLFYWADTPLKQQPKQNL